MATDEELKQPQRFPLTGDGLATQRVIASGPLNGPSSDIGEELALARYNDHQFDLALKTQPAERRSQMPDPEADRQADAYWEGLINRARQTEQNAQAYAAAPRQAAAEQTPQLHLEENPKIVLGR